jgi:hypothetical protein
MLVRNADNPITSRRCVILFRAIARLNIWQGVNAAIEFDKKLSPMIAEVEDIRAKRDLPPEVKAIQRAKRTP